MHKIEFEHENNSNFMLVTPEDQTVKDSYQIKMLTKNAIGGLLSVQVKYINNKKVYYYNITSKQSMCRLYEFTTINWKDLRDICIGISEMIKSIKDYMLDLDCVMLKPECIFIDTVSYKISFAYYPEETQSFQDMIRSLFEYILERYNHNTDKEELMQVYAIYQKILHDEYDAEHPEIFFVSRRSSFEIDSDNIQIEGLNNQQNPFLGKDEYNTGSDESTQRHNQEYSKTYEIPPQKITTETEVFVKNKSGGQFAVFFTGIILIVAGMVALFLPDKALVSFNIFGNLVIILIGIALCLVYQTMKKKSVAHSKIRNETIDKPYDPREQISMYEAQMSAYEMKNNIDTCVQDNVAKEQVEKTVDQACTTICLSQYWENTYTKKQKMILRFLGFEINYNGVVQEEVSLTDLNMDQLPCMIGNLKEYCDVVIESPLISRMHACIRNEDGNYFIQDMNSTNGTFINGTRLKPEEKIKIENGCEIRMGVYIYMVEIA